MYFNIKNYLKNNYKQTAKQIVIYLEILDFMERFLRFSQRLRLTCPIRESRH